MVGKILPGFVDQDFAAWLIWYWEQLPNKVDTGQRHRAFLNHQLGWSSRLHEKLRSLIAPYESDFDLTTAYLSDDYAPGGVHSDGWIPGYPGKRLSRTYLVPLEITGHHHTVVFRETSEEAVTFNAHMDMGDKGIVNYKQIDPSDVLDTQENTISLSVYQQYLDHLPYDKLGGLTLDCVLPWQLGGAISWPRAHFHCSANYDRTTTRFSLVMMTSCST